MRLMYRCINTRYRRLVVRRKISSNESHQSLFRSKVNKKLCHQLSETLKTLFLYFT